MLIDNHILDTQPSLENWADDGRWRRDQLAQRSVLVKRAEPLPIEAIAGIHDENISFEKAADLIGWDIAQKVGDISLKLYNFAADDANEQGIIIADTKFEFGLIDGELILIDELFTPDSCRFWPVDAYRPDSSPPSFDKQFVRDYLETVGWNKQAPVPELPEDVIAKTSEKYHEALSRLIEYS